MNTYRFLQNAGSSVFSKALSSYLTCLVLLIPCLLLSQECDDVTLTKVNAYYRLGKFEDVRQILNKCLDNGGFTYDEEQFTAHKILANVYLLMDHFELAEKEIELMLGYNPSYIPNRIDENAQFIDIVMYQFCKS